MDLVSKNLFMNHGNAHEYNKELLEDREVVEAVMKKKKTNQKLNSAETAIFRAEVLRQLYDVPADEELPELFGRTFSPIDYPLAREMVLRFDRQGMTDKRGRKYPMIVDTIKLQQTVFETAKKRHGYDYPLGARGFEIVDMRDAFLEHHDFDEYFDCYFLRTASGGPYRAWFHKDYKGIIRYYTVSPYQSDISRYAFDAIDLYGTVVGGSDVIDYENRRYLRHKSYESVRNQQPVMEEAYIFEERDRLKRVKSELFRMNRKESKDDKATQTLFLTMNLLIEEAIERTFQGGRFTSDYRTLFFMSTNELVRRMTKEKEFKVSKTTLNNAVNVLTALGFIEKMSDYQLYQHIGNSILVDERQRHARNDHRNPISYYTIKNIPSAYWIEKQINKMNAKRLTLHNVTERRFKRAFGRETTDKIFVNKDITKKKDLYINEKNEYIRLFLLEIRKYGFVTKESMDSMHNIPSQNVANKLWTELTAEVRGYNFKRSTKAIRDTLDIDAKGAVFVSIALVHPNEPTYSPHKTLDEERTEALVVEYEDLIDEVLEWYGDIFKIHKIKNKPNYTNPFQPDEILMDTLVLEGVA